MRITKAGTTMVSLALGGFAIGIAFKQSNSVAVVALICVSTGLFLVGVACWLAAIARWPHRRN